MISQAIGICFPPWRRHRLPPAKAREATKIAASAQHDRPGHRRAPAAQGGRPLHARARPVRRRHPPARHAGGGVPAQPAGARAHPRRSASRRPSASACSSPRTWPAWRRSGPTPRCRASSRRCSRSWPPARCATSASSIAMCVAPTRAEAEDIAGEIELDLEPLPVVADMLAARKPGAPLVHEHWGDNLFLTTATDVDFEAVKAKAAVVGDARAAHRAPGHEPARRAAAWSRHGTRGSSQLDRAHLDPAAAHRALGPGRVPGPRRGPDPRGRARRRRRLRLQGHPAARGGRARLGDAQARRAAALARGPAREPHRQRQLPRAPLHPHRLRRRGRAACWRSTARRPSIPAPTRPIRSPPAWRRARSAPSCRACTTSRTTAAAPTRSRPTSRRSCPIAASRARACASRWR